MRPTRRYVFTWSGINLHGVLTRPRRTRRKSVWQRLQSGRNASKIVGGQVSDGIDGDSFGRLQLARYRILQVLKRPWQAR